MHTYPVWLQFYCENKNPATSIFVILIFLGLGKMKKVDPEGDILKSSSLRREAMETNREKDKRKRSCTQNLSRFAFLEILLTIIGSFPESRPS